MNIHKLISVIGLIAIAFFTSTAANQVLSPLTTTKDAIGLSLQNTMIWASQETKGDAYFVAFRKSFKITSTPHKAKLHLFADVRYMAWINGQYVVRGPARFEPDGPEYDVIDIARFLKPGNNEIAVIVMANASNGKMRRHTPGLTARIIADGRAAVVTDETWKWTDQTRYRNAMIDWGNTHDRIDAQVEDGDWTQPGYSDLQWKTAVKINGDQWGKLSARRIPLLRDTQVPISLSNSQTLPITLSANQKLEFKLDRLVQAYTVLDIEADAGTELSLGYAGIKYVARAGRQTYISSDTYGLAGGSITIKSGRATILGFRVVERIYPFECVGSFKSNDPFLNKLWGVCARSLQIMSEDSYVDCADRERTEWMDNTPPCYDITRTAMAVPGENGSKIYGDPRLLEELLRRTALTLQPGGWVKAHTCSDRYDIHAKMEDRACDWVEGARLYYESTGNAAPIREIWPAIVAQMNYFLDRRSSRGLVIAREWIIWDNPMGYETSEGAGINACICKALVDAAFLGKVIKKTDDAIKFDKAAKDLSAAFNQVLWNEKEGTYYSGYDTDSTEMPKGVAKGKTGVTPDWHLKIKPPTLSNNLIASTVFPALFALDQEIVPMDRRQQVTNYLLAQPDPDTRIMFYYYYWKQLYATNQPSFDQRILDSMREKWKTMTNAPWQTTWEDFHVGSQAHCYGMFPGYFLSAYVLGVRRELPVWNKRLLIEPRLGDLKSVEGIVVTEFGLVPVSWKLSEGKLVFRVEIPVGVKASLRVPQMGDQTSLKLDGKSGVGKKEGRYLVTEVGSGTHIGTVSFTPITTAFIPKLP